MIDPLRGCGSVSCRAHLMRGVRCVRDHEGRETTRISCATHYTCPQPNGRSPANIIVRVVVANRRTRAANAEVEVPRQSSWPVPLQCGTVPVHRETVSDRIWSHVECRGATVERRGVATAVEVTHSCVHQRCGSCACNLPKVVRVSPEIEQRVWFTARVEATKSGLRVLVCCKRVELSASP